MTVDPAELWDGASEKSWTHGELVEAFRRCDALIEELRERGHSRPEAQAYKELKLILGVKS